MNVFQGDRAAIAETLTGISDGWATYDHLPGRAVPPCYVVMHDTPLISREATDPFGTATARYQVWCAAAPGPNDLQLESVESGAWEALQALAAAGFTVETVEQPIFGELNGTGYLTIPIHITTPISLT